MASSLRWASGIAALATAVGLAVVPSVQAQTMRAQAVAPAVTSLSIRVVDTRIEPGETGQVNGHLAIVGDLPAEGRTVTLEARTLGSTGFVPVAEVVAATQGGLSTDVLPQVTTRYRWRYAGDEDTRPSRSGIATIRVGDVTHDPHRLPPPCRSARCTARPRAASRTWSGAACACATSASATAP
jgi:hypothetical protein